MSTYLGKWVQDDGKGGFKQIEVIDVNGEVAFIKGAQNTSMSVNKLNQKWRRLDEMIDDPYASEDLAAIALQGARAESLQIDEEAIAAQLDESELVTEKPKQIVPAPVKILNATVSNNPLEAALEAAINASTETQTLDLTISVEVPIDPAKLSIIAKALNIDANMTAEVLSKATKVDSVKLRDMLKSAFREILTTESCTD